MTKREREKCKMELINDIKMIENVLKMEKDMINSELFTEYECQVIKVQLQVIKRQVASLIE